MTRAKLCPVILPMPVGATPPIGREHAVMQSRHARLALNHSALVSGAELGELAKNADDAPLPSNGWYWSISHTRTYAAGVVAKQPVGIDIERIEARGDDIAALVATESEIALLGGFDEHAFMRLWTAKEAVLKKAGVGLSGLSQCRLVAVLDERRMLVSHRNREHTVHQHVHDMHIAAVSADISGDVDIEWTWEGAGL